MIFCYCPDGIWEFCDEIEGKDCWRKRMKVRHGEEWEEKIGRKRVKKGREEVGVGNLHFHSIFSNQYIFNHLYTSPMFLYFSSFFWLFSLNSNYLFKFKLPIFHPYKFKLKPYHSLLLKIFPVPKERELLNTVQTKPCYNY